MTENQRRRRLSARLLTLARTSSALLFPVALARGQWGFSHVEAATVGGGSNPPATDHALCWRVLGGSGGSMSTGRHGMGAAMISDYDMLVFAGGLAHWEGQLDGTADIITGLRLTPESQRTSQTLTVPRTDIASAATARAAYFSGGCGIELAREGPDGTGVNSVEDCRPRSIVDIFSPIEGPHEQRNLRERRTARRLGASSSNRTDDAAALNLDAAAARPQSLEEEAARPAAAAAVVATATPPPSAPPPPARPYATEAMRTGGYRLCENKYAATSGVFYTGGPDEADVWAGTPHVMVAGGIIPAEPGLYRATDTVDIIREDAVVGETGAVRATLLPVQRLPLPRFDMASCCFKHVCLFAGGLVNLDGYYSDRVDVWDGRRWAFAAEHSLSEPRSMMGAAVLQVSLSNGLRPVGFFAGGLGKSGGSFLVDLYDFREERWLPRITMPTVRGPTRAVMLGRDVAAFIGDGGQVDLFNGSSLCWTSYEIYGMAVGGAAISRITPYFFNESSGYRTEEDGTAYFAGGVYNPGGSLSSSVYEMRMRLPSSFPSGSRMCPLGVQLQPVRRTCGVAGPSDTIDGFVEEGKPAAPQEQPQIPAQPPPGVAAGGVGTAAGGQSGAGGQQQPLPGGSDNGQGTGLEVKRLVQYTLIAVAALLTSYMVSATVIIRHVEGMWRLPVGGGTCDILCRGVSSFHYWLCSCCGGARRAAARASKGDRNSYHSIGSGINGDGPPPGGAGGDMAGGGKDVEAVRKVHPFVVTSAVAVQPYSVDDDNGVDGGRLHTGVHQQHAPNNGGGGDARDGRPPVPPRRPQARGANSRGRGVGMVGGAAARHSAPHNGGGNAHNNNYGSGGGALGGGGNGAAVDGGAGAGGGAGNAHGEAGGAQQQQQQQQQQQSTLPEIEDV